MASYAGFTECLVHPLLFSLGLRMLDPSMDNQYAPFHHPYFILTVPRTLDSAPGVTVVAQDGSGHAIFQEQLSHNRYGFAESLTILGVAAQIEAGMVIHHH